MSPRDKSSEGNGGLARFSPRQSIYRVEMGEVRRVAIWLMWLQSGKIWSHEVEVRLACSTIIDGWRSWRASHASTPHEGSNTSSQLLQKTTMQSIYNLKLSILLIFFVCVVHQQAVLKYEFREDGKPHNCLDDAIIPMKIVLHTLEHGLKSPIDIPTKLVFHA